MSNKPNIYSSREKLILMHGGVQGAARDIGDEAASETMHILVERAPEEIQASWPMVIAWHRIQLAYFEAESMGDTKMMIESAKSAAAMIKDLY